MRKFLVALLALCAAPAVAQIPRTPDGKPDFQGVWENRWLTPLEKTGTFTQLSVTQQQADVIVASVRKMAKTISELANDPEAGDPDAHSLAVVRGEYRTRMIIEPADGMLPYTPEGQKAAMQQQAWFTQRVITGRGEGPEDRLTWERCLAGMGQAPMLYGWAVAAFRQIVQTKDAVVIHSEGGGETRIIRIGGKPLPAGMGTFIGDSVARWEGDTLVVETTGFRKDDQFRMFVTGRPIMVGVNSKVVERFARVSGAELNYRFTVEDPAIYAKPWLAEYSLIPAPKGSDGKMFEFACHEGNYGLPNILSGQRQIEARKVVAAQAKPATPAK
ncbi:MAG TPA: hypothetical protein VGO52_19655 [Hyphomonadaceae bacterium]|jgi:hypothetical protein|nr:hypothetical protein [Hyphomonadaceae bacterium]